MSRQIIFTLSLFLLSALLAPLPTLAYTGTVVDGATKRPVEDALVTLNDVVVRSDDDGKFQISGHGDAIGLRAYGYGRQSISVSDLKDRSGPIALTPIMPKALYPSFYGIGSTELREVALGLINKTELNAVGIDVKGDRGMMAFKTSLSLAELAHSNELTTMRDAKALLDRLRRVNIYAIARIVVFKDDPLATARPDLAVKRAGGAIFRDRERLAWTDPFNTEVWDYNISIALEAARLGFDEIQFDYVRFPDAPGLKFSKPIDPMKGSPRRDLWLPRRSTPPPHSLQCISRRRHLWLCNLEPR